MPRLLLIPAVGLLVAGLWLATVAGAEDQPTVRDGVYGPDTCDNSQQGIDTRIVKGPKGKTDSSKAKISFEGFYCYAGGDDIDSDFLEFTCKLDKDKNESCSTPVKLKKLKKGKHKFSVAANLEGGQSSFGDPSPAVAKWKIGD